MKFISEAGDALGYLFIVFLTTMILFFKKVWKLALQGVLILILASGLNILLKGFVARPRPFEDSLVYASFYSFPSGHAMSAMVFYGFLIHIVFSLEIKPFLKYLFTLIFVFISFIIGLSRIYLGVHYASDILGGYFAGLIWLMFCLMVIYSLKIRTINTNKT
ncbi:phosphatase PAP2 family protein [Pedobacter cryophilus]|nr:phosphatase PAP2 family protein [Pedobacter cryophilus]